MLLTLVLVTMLRQSIEVPAGYYTLSELASRLSEEGTPLRALDDCASDVYALRLSKAGWPQVREALQRDDRLVISQQDGVWKIERVFKTKTAERTQLTRYLRTAADQIQAVYGFAAQTCRELARLPAAERDRKANTFMPGPVDTPAHVAASRLIYLNFELEVPFSVIGAIAEMTAPGIDPVFAQARKSNLFDAANMMLPTGSLRDLRIPGMDLAKASDEELAAFGKGIQVAAKIALDPISLDANFRLCGFRADGAMTLQFQPHSISPGATNYKITIDPKSVWNAAWLNAQSKRISQTDVALQGLSAQMDTPDQTLRTSEALLRWADLSGQNLVYCVPAFSDAPIHIAKSISLKSIVDSVNGGKTDERWCYENETERTGGADSKARRALNPRATLTVNVADGIVVLRDETRFLDGLSSSPIAPPGSIANRRFRGMMPSLDEVAKHVASLKLPQWRNAVFASNYLTYCNPVTFRPFAIALGSSPTLRKAMSQLAEGKGSVLALALIEKSAVDGLIRAIEESQDFNDATDRGFEPMMAGSLLRGTEMGDLKITLTRSGGTSTLSLAGRGDEIWHSWIRNVECESPGESPFLLPR